jgi:dephospho-CoA kinase
VKLIMIVGQAGSGKSTAGQILKKHNYIVLEAGDIIRERFAYEGIPGESILSFTERLFETEGYDLHVGRIANTLHNLEELDEVISFTVVIGLRTPLQLQNLSKLFSSAFTVAIYASPKTRFERVKERHRIDDPDGFVEFIRKDFRELAWGLDKVLYATDTYIINEGTLIEFERQLLSLPFLSVDFE